MSEWDYSWDYGGGTPYDDWSWDTGAIPSADMGGWGYDPSTMAFSQNPLYEGGTPGGGGWGYDPATGQFSQAPMQGSDYTTAGGGGLGWLGSVLGGLGGFLGKNAGTIGPLLSGAGALAGGGIGANAANDAARLQSQALNRGIDLQTAQWLQQQQNLAPYLEAGRGGLSQLQQLAGREQPQFQDPAAAISGANYQLPSTAPGWQPQMYQGPQAPNAGDYRWNPQQGPSAQDYRYTPGQTPDAAGYRWTPGQAPSAAQYRYTPGAVPTLSGQELLANDPGVAFREEQARKGLEASAAAKGDLLSGGTLSALQRQGQDLASQEYGNAWNRAREQAQLREQWGQRASELGFGQSAEEARLREAWAQQASQQGFSQAEAASRLREQVNQVASQQGWTQAQAEAAFREGQAQLASQQGWNQALAGQQNQFTQGLQGQQWNQQQQEQWQTQLYNRQLEQQKLRYGQDVSQNQTDYDRANALYKQRLASYMLPWEQQSTLANLGGQAVGMYGQQGGAATRGISDLLAQQGTAQGTGAYGSGLSWMNALTGAGNQIRPLLSGLNA